MFIHVPWLCRPRDASPWPMSTRKADSVREKPQRPVNGSEAWMIDYPPTHSRGNEQLSLGRPLMLYSSTNQGGFQFHAIPCDLFIGPGGPSAPVRVLVVGCFSIGPDNKSSQDMRSKGTKPSFSNHPEVKSPRQHPQETHWRHSLFKQTVKHTSLPRSVWNIAISYSYCLRPLPVVDPGQGVFSYSACFPAAAQWSVPRDHAQVPSSRCAERCDDARIHTLVGTGTW